MLLYNAFTNSCNRPLTFLCSWETVLLLVEPLLHTEAGLDKAMCQQNREAFSKQAISSKAAQIAALVKFSLPLIRLKYRKEEMQFNFLIFCTFVLQMSPYKK